MKNCNHKNDKGEYTIYLKSGDKYEEFNKFICSQCGLEITGIIMEDTQ